MNRIYVLFGVMLFGLTLTVTAQTVPPVLQQAQLYRVEIINTYPHDGEAFTQGLIWYEGVLYESTGLRGESSLRRVTIESGEAQQLIEVRRDESTDITVAEYFAEGLERVDDRLIQLTWTAGEAFVYDLESFERIETIDYDGEGWGLCYDDRYLYMSDGSSYISIREADTFDLIGRFLVTLNGQPMQGGLLNELECVGDTIYANLWQTDYIAMIDKYTGNVTGFIDASDLLSEAERSELVQGAVLNGIAYNEDSDTFYITGKKWSQLFEVRFVLDESQQE